MHILSLVLALRTAPFHAGTVCLSTRVINTHSYATAPTRILVVTTITNAAIRIRCRKRAGLQPVLVPLDPHHIRRPQLCVWLYCYSSPSWSHSALLGRMQQLPYSSIGILLSAALEMQSLLLLPLLPEPQVQGGDDEQVEHRRGDQSTQDDNRHRVLNLVTRDVPGDH